MAETRRPRDNRITMTPVDLWNTAADNAGAAQNLLRSHIKDGDELLSVIRVALDRLRAATAAMEALQRISAGVPQPKAGE